MKELNFKDLSELGLIYKINKEILYPLGLSLKWNTDTKLGDI